MPIGALPAALAVINHLLAGEDWARDRLRPFAGKTARLELGALSLSLKITGDGFFAADDAGDGAAASAAVTMTLPADAPWRLLRGRAALLAGAKISGSVELAEVLAFIFRHLRWDLEADLAPRLGDIAARRVAQGSRHLAHWPIGQAGKLALNFAEYFTEEQPLIAARRELASFAAEVGNVADALARLEQRIAALEN